MSVVSIGLDLAKSVFQVNGVDAAGHTVLRRRLARRDLSASYTTTTTTTGDTTDIDFSLLGWLQKSGA